MINQTRKLISVLGSTRFTILCLFTLGILIVSATFTQASAGLSAATGQYIESWFVLMGGVVPFPGIKPVAGLLGGNLLLSLLREPIGPSTPVRLGLIVLLTGILIPSQQFDTLRLELSESESVRTAEIPGTWEIALQIGNGPEKVYHLESLKRGNRLPETESLVGLVVVEMHPHSRLYRLPGRRHVLIPLSQHYSDESVAGLRLFLGDPTSGSNTGLPREIYLHGYEQPRVEANFGEIPVTVELRRPRVSLPFTLQLEQVEETDRKTPANPNGFRSRIILVDSLGQHRFTISPGNPGRYGNVSMFQKKYLFPGPHLRATIALVRNSGRPFPYLAGLLALIGGMMHAGNALLTGESFRRRKR